MDKQHKTLIDELVKLLHGGSAHAGFKDAVGDLPAKLRGQEPDKLPYSIWQLVEHIRIAQWDMLRFCTDAKHRSPKWPEEYWPKESAPENDTTWENSLTQIDNDLDEFIGLIKKG